MTHPIVGYPIARLDGLEKGGGATRYAADVALPGLVWGKALRSPLPHARTVRVDISAVAPAVADACGARILDLPVTAGKVYLALREKRA